MNSIEKYRQAIANAITFTGSISGLGAIRGIDRFCTPTKICRERIIKEYSGGICTEIVIKIIPLFCYCE